MIQLLELMGIEVELPVVVRVDNMGAIFMSENASSIQGQGMLIQDTILFVS